VSQPGKKQAELYAPLVFWALSRWRKLDQHSSGIRPLARLEIDRCDDAVDCGGNCVFHFHGLDYTDHVTGLYGVTRLGRNGKQYTSHGNSNLQICILRDWFRHMQHSLVTASWEYTQLQLQAGMLEHIGISIAVGLWPYLHSDSHA